MGVTSHCHLIVQQSPSFLLHLSWKGVLRGVELPKCVEVPTPYRVEQEAPRR